MVMAHPIGLASHNVMLYHSIIVTGKTNATRSSECQGS